MKSKFPIPSALQDLEREPYNLLPYPVGFNDIDEASRAESFDELLSRLDEGNKLLADGGILLFGEQDADDGFNEWNDDDRVQAMYTLVRKSSSLSPNTRAKLVSSIVHALKSLCSVLTRRITTGNLPSGLDDNEPSDVNTEQIVKSDSVVSMTQSFRDAFSCHMYMLYTVMFIMESDLKADKTISSVSTSKGKSAKKNGERAKRGKEQYDPAECIEIMREESIDAMLFASQTMSMGRYILWPRGVPDESVIGLPLRISFLILEAGSTAQSRKAVIMKNAINIIAISLSADDRLFNTSVVVLVDLLHSYEHAASLIADLCCVVEEQPVNRLAVELLREIGRIDTSNLSPVETEGKASGVKNVAPFIIELAERKPQVLFTNMDLILSHMNSDPYYFRSAIVSAIGIVLTKSESSVDDDTDGDTEWEDSKMVSRKEKMFETTDKLFNVLIERARDVNSFVRAAAMKSFAYLIEKRSLPMGKLLSVTALSIDRLQDRTVIVRRNSMQVLTLLLKENPFIDSLDGEKYRVKEAELKLFLIENAVDELKEARLHAIQELDQSSDNYISSVMEIDTAFIKAVIESVEGNDIRDTLREQELFTKTQAYKFVDMAISFINLFEAADETFRNFLLSSNTSDVVEALRFFVQANHLNMPFSIRGIKEALCLMWSSDVNVQDEVLNSFVDVFITVPGTERSEFLPSKKISQNLILLINKANASEQASIEQVISRLVKKELIPCEVFSILWSIAAKASSTHVRAAAMLLLSMGATADASIVDSASRLRHLLEAGLGDYTERNRDWITAKAAATALQRVKVVSIDRQSAKFLVIEQILERLILMIKGSWCLNDDVDDSKRWFGAAEQSINAVFVLCDKPEKTCKDIISSMEAATFGFGEGHARSSCHSLQLSRFFFVVSHIALKLLVYTESLSGSVRRAKSAKITASHEESLRANNEKSSVAGEARETSDSIESELGLAQAEEAEAESKIAEISEKEIVGRGIIGLFAPLVVRVVADTSGSYNSEMLMQTSTLALCKFMCISGTFCSKYLPLLFRSLTNAQSNDVTLRANTVIALGDLAFRFPNEFEPYTSHLYACLRDKSTRVRRHSLMVLTHLILNDMIKCKGQVCEIALCLQDKETSIRDMARLLFNELSKRSNNPIYNLLPDIISRLSVMSVKQDDFRRIMTFLLSFIKKDKQNETLVDKLCQRFSKCTMISETADISFCITQLKMNAKCVKILIDHFKSYRDALFDEDVYKNFVAILSKLKKIPGIDDKEILIDWEKRLKECRSVGIENNVVTENANGKRKKTRNRVAIDSM